MALSETVPRSTRAEYGSIISNFHARQWSYILMYVIYIPYYIHCIYFLLYGLQQRWKGSTCVHHTTADSFFGNRSLINTSPLSSLHKIQPYAITTTMNTTLVSLWTGEDVPPPNVHTSSSTARDDEGKRRQKKCRRCRRYTCHLVFFPDRPYRPLHRPFHTHVTVPTSGPPPFAETFTPPSPPPPSPAPPTST